MNLIGGRNYIFPRFYRHAFLIGFDALDSCTVQRIFATLSEWHFSQGFADKVAMLTKVCVSYERNKNFEILILNQFIGYCNGIMWIS